MNELVLNGTQKTEGLKAPLLVGKLLPTALIYADPVVGVQALRVALTDPFAA